MFYRIFAERVRNYKTLMSAMERIVEVCVFRGDYAECGVSLETLFIAKDRDEALRIQELIWEYNNGAYAGMTTVSQDEFDEVYA